MSFEPAFVIVTWLAIAMLALGMIGCLRSLQLLSESIETRLQSPRRLEAGDRLLLPPPLADTVRPDQAAVLLFVQAECSACLTALERLHRVVKNIPDTDLLVFWKGDRHPRFPDLGTPHASDVYKSLHIALTPYFVLLRDDTVLASSRVGSKEALDKAEALVVDVTGDLPVEPTTISQRA